MLVLPSYIETFPASLLEAMAEGLPIVASAVGGIEKIVEDTVEGFVIQAGAVQMLSKSIGRPVNDTDLWATMSQAASRKVNSKFS